MTKELETKLQQISKIMKTIEVPFIVAVETEPNRDDGKHEVFMSFNVNNEQLANFYSAINDALESNSMVNTSVVN